MLHRSSTCHCLQWVSAPLRVQGAPAKRFAVGETWLASNPLRVPVPLPKKQSPSVQLGACRLHGMRWAGCALRSKQAKAKDVVCRPRNTVSQLF